MDAPRTDNESTRLVSELTSAHEQALQDPHGSAGQGPADAASLQHPTTTQEKAALINSSFLMALVLKRAGWSHDEVDRWSLDKAWWDGVEKRSNVLWDEILRARRQCGSNGPCPQLYAKYFWPKDALKKRFRHDSPAAFNEKFKDKFFKDEITMPTPMTREKLTVSFLRKLEALQDFGGDLNTGCLCYTVTPRTPTTPGSLLPGYACVFDFKDDLWVPMKKQPTPGSLQEGARQEELVGVANHGLSGMPEQRNPTPFEPWSQKQQRGSNIWAPGNGANSMAGQLEATCTREGLNGENTRSGSAPSSVGRFLNLKPEALTCEVSQPVRTSSEQDVGGDNFSSGGVAWARGGEVRTQSFSGEDGASGDAINTVISRHGKILPMSKLLEDVASYDIQPLVAQMMMSLQTGPRGSAKEVPVWFPLSRELYRGRAQNLTRADLLAILDAILAYLASSNDLAPIQVLLQKVQQTLDEKWSRLRRLTLIEDALTLLTLQTPAETSTKPSPCNPMSGPPPTESRRAESDESLRPRARRRSPSLVVKKPFRLGKKAKTSFDADQLLAEGPKWESLGTGSLTCQRTSTSLGHQASSGAVIGFNHLPNAAGVTATDAIQLGPGRACS
ncbi:hypothetical protein KFL_010780030 [Klebsormidium nitens]|uniref:Uncharacterized protein n=1 Tax=Klebsormidium nitens TaxID=105231 RepID=A0A1Y1IPN1_KLENI|nr:hypothetical protein KFL_010780030 [Klebsormidium nitens]|eukprot:GAQ92633.1 hypothetical protein KFL_010780030 [Klebsormidium nitens]